MAHELGGPRWQTDELIEEWVSEAGSEPSSPISISPGPLQDQPTPTRRSSFNISSNSLSSDHEPPSPEQGGTFLIRDDQPLPETPLGLRPGQKVKKGGIKTFFSPLALERMFDPPSPPHSTPQPAVCSQPSNDPSPPPPPPPKPVFTSTSLKTKTPSRRSKLSQCYVPSDSDKSLDGTPMTQQPQQASGGGTPSDEIVASDIPGLVAFDGRKPSATFQFTFTLPKTPIHPSAFAAHFSPPNHTPNPRGLLAPHSTPLPTQDDPTGTGTGINSRLRLFQFQYDTFTRDHLGALADSIAVKNSPGSDGSPFSMEHDRNGPVWRSTKRIKLSPPEELDSRNSTISAAFRASPWGKSQSRDYFRGSMSLAKRIRKGQDVSFSPGNYSEASFDVDQLKSAALDLGKFAIDELQASASSSATADTQTATLATLPDDEPPEDSPPKPASVNYRLQGANILAQIKADMKGNSGRNFSWSSHSDASSIDSILSGESSYLDGEKSQKSIFPELAPAHRSLGVVEEVTEELSTPTSSTSKKISPRKLLRRLSAADEVDRELADLSLDSSRDLSFSRQHSSRDYQKPDKSSLSVSQYAVPPTTVFSVVSQQAPPPYVSVTEPAQPLLSHRRQPSSPSGSLHPNHQQVLMPTTNQDDLNRFVSSSTTSGASGTTAGSFVKHPGPPVVQMRTISPGELHGVIPERVNGMVFSKIQGKWVKEVDPQQEEDDHSEDPFGDIESLLEDTQSGRSMAAATREVDDDREILSTTIEQLDVSVEDGALIAHSTSVPERSFFVDDRLSTSESDDDTERPLSPPAISNVALQFDDTLQFTTDDETPQVQSQETPQEQADSRQPRTASVQVAPPQSDADDLSVEVANLSTQESSPTAASTPHTNRQQPAPPPRSALKATPFRSGQSTPFGPVSTPHANANASSGFRRSVSFSDGRKTGKIRGLKNVHDDTEEESLTNTNSSITSSTTSSSAAQNGVPPPADTDNASPPSMTSSYVPSARTKRMLNILDELEDSDEPDTFITRSRPVNNGNSQQNRSTSGNVSSTRSHANLAPAIEAHSSSSELDGSDQGEGDAGRGVRVSTFPSSLAAREAAASRSFARTTKRSPGEMTFLTDASFRVTHDELVRILTQVQPYEVYWDQLRQIDLSDKGVDSLARLKEFLPNLDKLVLHSNRLAWLSGVPSSVRTLAISHNLLTSLTSYVHLPNIEYLDISNNRVDSLQQLECLRHLRDLKADNNVLSSIDGLSTLDTLVRISLKGNRLKGDVDLSGFAWTRVEVLNLAQNAIRSVVGLGAECLPNLVTLDLDANHLRTISTTSALPKLRVLRLSDNKLARLDVKWFPSLRTLYADNNRLGDVLNARKLTRLENLSLRYQKGTLELSMKDIRDVKRLYLSGNPLTPDFIVEPCYNLVYLEIASCALTSLPTDMAKLAPNLRVLNANYNFLTDVRPALDGLVRMRKLTLVGSRLKGSRGAVKVVQKMPDLEILDLRMNPFTLGWYIPVIVNDLQGALQPSDTDHQAPHDKGTDHSAPASHSNASSSACTTSTTITTVPRKRRAPTLDELDARFRANLPDEMYIARLGFRALVMHACTKLVSLDGLVVAEPEREKARKLLKGLNDRKAGPTSNGPSGAGTTLPTNIDLSGLVSKDGGLIYGMPPVGLGIVGKPMGRRPAGNKRMYGE